MQHKAREVTTYMTKNAQTIKGVYPARIRGLRIFALLFTVACLGLAAFLPAFSSGYAAFDNEYVLQHDIYSSSSYEAYYSGVGNTAIKPPLSDNYSPYSTLSDPYQPHLFDSNNDESGYVPIAPLNAVEEDVANAAELAALFPGDGSDLIITLTDSFTLSSMHTIASGRTVTIISDDAGVERVLTAANGTRHFSVNAGGTLILGAPDDPLNPAADFNNFTLTGGSITGTLAAGSGGSVTLMAGTNLNPGTGGTLYMYGGTITGNTADIWGGGVHIGNNASFEMHGGTITNNTAGQSGGGVGTQGTTTQSASFIMHDGEISHNTAAGTGGAHGGGGVFLQGFGSTFEMHDGLIYDNNAHQGGGVRIGHTVVPNNNSFVMHGGEISYNTATADATSSLSNVGGGGIHLGHTTTFTLNDGTICHNTAASGGGVLSLFGAAGGTTFVMNDGEIIHNNASGPNSANGGGGVMMQGFGTTFTMHDGIIGHNSGNLGGGVRIIQSATGSGNTFTMNGGEIYDNEARVNTGAGFSQQRHGGGGVMLGEGITFIMNDGTISYNRASTGAGVSTFAHATLGATLIMNDGEISHNIASGALINEGDRNSTGGGGVFLQGTGTTFTMNDGLISDNFGVQGGGVRLDNTAGTANTFTMNGGEIYRNTATVEVSTGQSHLGGGGLFMSTNTTFIMNDGEITYNQAANGGGILTAQSGSAGSMIEMHDGEVSHNTATSSHNHHGGGGIFMQGTGSVFDMYDGLVYGNQAQHGGGVRIGNGPFSNAIFNMHGGIIENNTTVTTGTGGAGVHLGHYTTFNMHDGSIITNNTANGNGGGVGNNSDNVRGTIINIFGGEITYNTSLGSIGGGGMFVQGAATVFTLTGDATINNNTANAQGGGVYMRQGVFTMESGTITENDSLAAGAGGGGVFLFDGGAANAVRFYMEGGSISHNNARGDGGGLATQGGTATPGIQFTMSGDATIYENRAAGALGGGGVLLQGPNTRLDMESGTIHNNHAIHGGGARVNGGTLNMTGGEIFENSTNTVINGVNRIGRGAGVMLIGVNSQLILSGPETVAIWGNEAGTSGGAVNLDNSSRFTMNGGSIHNNIARGVGSNHGGGAVTMGHVLCEFVMNDGVIEHNYANRGGGVHSIAGLVRIIDGSIRHNTATIDGGGAWIGIGAPGNPPAIPATGARINMTGGSFTNNTATAGDGGAIFANPTRTEDPLPAGAYPNVVSASGVFGEGLLANYAGGGLFVPPSNYLDFSFGHLLTNFNINYRTTWLVLFDLNGGHINNNTSNISFTVDARAGGEYVTSDRVPPMPEKEGYIFAGWRHPDSEQYDDNGDIIELVVLPPEDVANHFINGSTQFIAQWIPDVVFTGITPGNAFNLGVFLVLVLAAGRALYSRNKYYSPPSRI